MASAVGRYMPQPFVSWSTKVSYHGRTLTILWDKTGNRYNKGAGLRLLVDGKEIAHSETLKRLTAKLP